MRKLAFACGAISIISWISVCTLGVLDKVSIGYEQIMILYIGILMIGIPSALFIEKRELENKLKA
jgi:hypothetical protein